MMEHNRPVISSLYSRVSAGASSHPLSSVSLSSDGAHAVATGRDVVHVLGLNLEKAGNALQEVKSVRISQVRFGEAARIFGVQFVIVISSMFREVLSSSITTFWGSHHTSPVSSCA